MREEERQRERESHIVDEFLLREREAKRCQARRAGNFFATESASLGNGKYLNCEFIRNACSLRFHGRGTPFRERAGALARADRGNASTEEETREGTRPKTFRIVSSFASYRLVGGGVRSRFDNASQPSFCSFSLRPPIYRTPNPGNPVLFLIRRFATSGNARKNVNFTGRLSFRRHD